MPPEDLPRAEFGFPGPLRDLLLRAIHEGRKTTTTALFTEFEAADEPLPKPGSREVLIDSAGLPVGVIEIVEVRRLRLAEVDLAHAIAEGEGHRSVHDWRVDHERFWHSHEFRDSLGDPDFAVDDDTLVVTQRFRLISR
ncbi:ASCH domain-containing protein [Actinoalloteichus hymeniacidonis]|uniref:ASCH domain-containing protein n=1 Tax=Actinoalloteichus hymeniacidonis TaxID=340345 RepID=A0AAC9MXX8_9PSEU|nr:ASCH domain-containing protein [Actinoalloteichus hymeniacidonis]AOS62417.1 hypothetical protein TL08_08000 [Actinoalloteichus hymeniacidonis]MBB5909552.1 uncharacterized protein YhfF [Actinoalloteichus hymeniacidonis]